MHRDVPQDAHPHGASALDQLRALATDREREASRRFERARDRDEHLLTRGLVRSTLARALGCAADRIELGRGSHGRPFIAYPPCALDFNVAHSGGLVACLIGPAALSFGVDVEDMRRLRALEVADDFFAPAEVEAIRAAPASEAQRILLSFWTLKEAYIKARGLGLAIPLHSFAFDLEGGRIRLTIGEDNPVLPDGARDEGGAWSFRLVERSEHLIAIAARSSPLPELRVRSVT